jgi:AcrR family transcriptional regulator
MGERRNSRNGQATRDRIIDAALETVRADGLVGASVRAIARTGDFNQALVFYHFGSVEELLLAALERANERRISWLADRLAKVDSLGGLVDVAIELHSDNCDADHMALSAIVAGWSSRDELGPRIMETLQPWDELIEGALERTLADTPLAGLAPITDLAHAVSALFLGMEIYGRLEGDERINSLYASLADAAHAVGPFLAALAGATFQAPDPAARQGAVVERAPAG